MNNVSKLVVCGASDVCPIVLVSVQLVRAILGSALRGQHIPSPLDRILHAIFPALLSKTTA